MAKIPPTRPRGFDKDKAHDIKRLKLGRPITARIIAAAIESQPITSITPGNLDTWDWYISKTPITSLTATAIICITSLSKLFLK